ncbi:MAG: patatin-like phospholipase family protein [bacterium]
MKKRALVISGGGSKGAFAGGLAQKLYERGHRWNNFYGTSTGALLNILIPLNDFKLLKNIYTNINNKNIFDNSPFNQKGKLNIFRAIWRAVRGKTSIGTARNLRKLIKNTYTQKKHNEIINAGKIVCACTTNFSKGCVEYGYNTKEDYNTFVDYTFASASVPIAMDLVNIYGDEYMDGGVMEHVPLQQAIRDGVDEIDVIVLRPNYDELSTYWESNNIVSVAMRSMQLMMKEISEADLIIGKLKNELNKDIIINLYYVPHELTGNSLVFDPDIMKYWWDSGYRVDVPEYSDEKLKSSGIKLKEYRIRLVK